jgi:predicted membrane-bound spermidine synthase
MNPQAVPAKSLSFIIGLLSLGSETLWIRTFSFHNESMAKSVPVILGVYLLGIAFGAARGSRFCKDGSKLVEILGLALLAGAGAIFLGPVLIAVSVELLADARLLHAVPAFVAAYAFAICFPICHHLGTVVKTGATGKSMSRVYAANIAGSVIGPLFVNFVLLQFATTQLAFALLGLAACLVALAVLFATARGPLKSAGIAATIVALASVSASAGPSNWLIGVFRNYPVAGIVETRQGTVVSYRQEHGGDAIFGGNVYDGRTNLDPRVNSNKIDRVLVLAALRPEPKRVLEIGLSIGTWNYLLTGFPGVEAIDVVEINPGYLELMKNYPAQQRTLAEPRVNLVIGDGRKFLRSQAQSTYDLIVINTTWHWRAYAALLLSREFLTLVHTRMAPGAVLAYNTTGSPDALYTATVAFPHAYLYDNFVIAADFDWRTRLDAPGAIDELRRIRPEGKPLFSPPDESLMRYFLSRERTTTVEQAAAKAGRPLEVITDRNLITEYKYGRPLFERWGW